ncbi:MAG: hypothetical protein ACRYHA_18870, partial [Janthinobacterium lividum]
MAILQARVVPCGRRGGSPFRHAVRRCLASALMLALPMTTLPTVALPMTALPSGTLPATDATVPHVDA